MLHSDVRENEMIFNIFYHRKARAKGPDCIMWLSLTRSRRCINGDWLTKWCKIWWYCTKFGAPIAWSQIHWLILMLCSVFKSILNVKIAPKIIFCTNSGWTIAPFGAAFWLHQISRRPPCHILQSGLPEVRCTGWFWCSVWFLSPFLVVILHQKSYFAPILAEQLHHLVQHFGCTK